MTDIPEDNKVEGRLGIWILPVALRNSEEIVKCLESGELSLEESLEKFEEGIRLAKQLEAILDKADSRIQEILKTSEETQS